MVLSAFSASLNSTMLGLLLAVSPPFAVATELPRVGILYAASAGTPSLQALAKALSELGYRDRQNVVLEYRFAEGNPERLPALAKEPADLPVQVIVAVAGETLIAAKRATDSIPIVSANGGGDYVAMGLISSWEHPGGNVTGMNLSAAEATRKRVQIFKETVPSLSRLAVIFYAPYPSSPQLLAAMESAATQHNIQVDSISVTKPEDLEGAIAAAKQTGAHAVMTLQGSFFFSQMKTVIALAAKYKLPLAMGEPFSAEAGALLEVNPDVPGCVARSATFVDRILKDARPGELAIERFSGVQVTAKTMTNGLCSMAFLQTITHWAPRNGCC